MAQQHMVFIGETWEVEQGSAKPVLIEGSAPLALFRLGDEFFVLDDTCTHGEASLSEGDIFDGEIECPFHSGRFDIRTGEATRFPCVRALRSYRVKVEDEKIYVDLATGGTS